MSIMCAVQSSYASEIHLPIGVRLIAKSSLNQEQISKLQKSASLKTTTKTQYNNLQLYNTQGKIVTAKQRTNARQRKLDVLFRRADKNNDGLIEKEEFLERIKLEITAQWFQSMDKDNNNRIARDELTLYNPPQLALKQPDIIYQ